ncbi:MAG TPA: hypothetical protein PLP05_07105 [Sedimentisphaerales bacterium]|nr:hypothetical protein [Sedimentisphaerales bacterium]
MIKRKYVLCLLLLCMMSDIAQSKIEIKPLDVGRENPFSQLIKEEAPLDIEQEQPLQKRISKETAPEVSVPELFVETVILKFLDAESLKAVIMSMSSSYGGVSIDTKSNSLIICDSKENLAKIVAQIKKVDTLPQQIMVEMVILDVQLDNSTEIGINWDILSDKTYDIGYRQNLTGSRLTSTIEDSDTVGNATAFNTVGTGGDFSVISGTIRNVVHLIQEKRNVEILASPRVMTLSGQTAYIEAIDEIPYREESQSSEGGVVLTYTEFKDVGVKLEVSPILTDEGNILLTVVAEQNVQSATSDTGAPRVDTRKAKSSLLLKDGQIVVLGGLRRQEKTKEVNQIPILGDCPVVGELFKNTNDVVKNSELIVFLSPHIYRNNSLSDDETKKFEEITNRPMLSLPINKDTTKK